MADTTQVVLEFGISKENAQNIAKELLELRKHADDKYKGHLRYTADLMREIALQLPRE